MGAQSGIASDDPLVGYTSAREGNYELVEESEDSCSSDGEFAASNEDVIVQFTSQLYFVEEDEGATIIDIMRLGPQTGRVSCWFNTEDMSGKAGERYKSTKTKVVFEAGECQKSVSVPIIASDRWAVTLEFRGVLTRPKGCTLGKYLKTCRVKVIDDTHFPSSRYPKVGQGMAALKTIGILSLFWEYVKMNYAVPGVAWRTLLCIIFDQMRNIYLFFKLWAITYMLNVIFNDSDEDTALTVDQRARQAFLIGLGYILPMLALHMWELAKVHIDLTGQSRVFLQDSIITKYLNYDERSRSEVDIADIQIAVRESSNVMAESYTALLAVLQTVGKLIVILYFTLHQNPAAMGAVLAMPCLMLVFAPLRHGMLSKAQELPNDIGARIVAFVAELARNYRLIASYHQRPMMNDMFGQKVSAWRLALTTPASVALNNDFFTQWLGPMFVGVYIMGNARSVITGDIGQGTFVAMLSVFGGVADLFSEGYKEFLKITSAGSDIRCVIEILNRSTDLPMWKAVNRKRRAHTKVAREQVIKETGSRHLFPTDLIKFEFKNMGYTVQGKQLLQDVCLSVAQGSIVAVLGSHGHGRNTFLKLIAHEIFPTAGEILIPTHLRILCVSQDIQLLESSLMINLTFGNHTDFDAERVDRAIHILERLGAGKLAEDAREASTFREESTSTIVPSARTYSHRSNGLDSQDGSEDMEEDGLQCCNCCPAEENCQADVVPMKQEALSYSERAKLHIARALLMNPEVMVLQRPLAHFNHADQDKVLDLIHEHVRNRGIGLPPETAHLRRPRTVFLSVESEELAKHADVVWDMVRVGSSTSVSVVRGA